MTEFNPLLEAVIFDTQGTLWAGQRTNLQPRRDLREGLAYLLSRSVTLGIVVKSDTNLTRRELIKAGVADLFEKDNIIGRDYTDLGLMRGASHPSRIVLPPNVMPVKPNPAPVNFLLKSWNLRPDQAAFVGDDSFDDGACAQSAGVRFHLIPPIEKGNTSLLEFLQTEVLPPNL